MITKEGFDPATLKAIRDAIVYLEQEIGLKFIEVNSPPSLSGQPLPDQPCDRETGRAPNCLGWIHFVSSDLCGAEVGFKGCVEHKILLSNSCKAFGTKKTERGEAVHEIGHVLGFFHEHQRPGRDAFVQVNLDLFTAIQRTGNVVKAQELLGSYKELDPSRDSIIDDSTYDTASIMHYGFNEIMEAKKPALNQPGCCKQVGLRNVLSEKDRAAFRKLYSQ